MCGIVGLFDLRGKRDFDRELLSRLNDSQFHRGPDEGGLHLEPGVGLGHRRLAIIFEVPASSRLGHTQNAVLLAPSGHRLANGLLAPITC